MRGWKGPKKTHPWRPWPTPGDPRRRCLRPHRRQQTRRSPTGSRTPGGWRWPPPWRRPAEGRGGNAGVSASKKKKKGALTHLQDEVAAQVGVPGGGRADAEGFISESHVGSAAVGSGEHGDSGDPQAAGGGEDAAGDLPAVGHQQLVDGGGREVGDGGGGGPGPGTPRAEEGGRRPRRAAGGGFHGRYGAAVCGRSELSGRGRGWKRAPRSARSRHRCFASRAP